MINTSQNLAQKTYKKLYLPKLKLITHHIYLFAKAARKLRDKYND